MLGRTRRLAVLAEGCFAPLESKTAIGVLRYRPADVAAVLDSTRAGRTAGECVGVGGEVPVVATLDQAGAHGANALVVGIAPQGGGLPAAWRPTVRAALERGWDLLSGLHVFLAEDPELAAIARARGAAIVDLRRPPAERRVAAGRARELAATVVLTVGTDCNVGKMTCALELERALAARGARAAFVATGQTGILIAGGGVPVDAVVSDFVAGAIEHEVLVAAAAADLVIVEGQGSLLHPAYSAVTLGLMHGACPAAMVLCHEAGRERVRLTAPDAGTFPLPSLAETARLYAEAAAWVRPAPVIGVALNTWRLDAEEAHAAVAAAARATGLPAADPVRFDAGALADAVLATHAARRDHAAHS